jgi:putative hydrolase of HD superfamily
MKKPDIHRLLDLQRLLADFSRIERKVDRRHLKGYIAENDTEHSYNLAMTAWYLSSWFPELDKNKLIQYGLVHDLVEVHAGDTPAYGTEEELNTKAAREAEALKKLEKDWPDFKDLTEMLQDYEEKTNSEARFIYALDKLMPIMLVYTNEGHSWKKFKVTVEMVQELKAKKVSKSSEIVPYYDELVKLMVEHPELIKIS